MKRANQFLRANRGPIHIFSSLVGINFLLAGLSFLTTLVVANALGRGHFGDLSYALAVGSYALTIVYCGIEQTLVRDLAQHSDKFDEYVSASLVLRGSLLVAAMLGIYCLNSMASEGDRLGSAGFLIVFAEGVKALYLAQIYDARGKMQRHALYLLAERCLYFVGVWCIILFFKEKLSMPTIAVFMIASTFLGIFLQYLWAFRRVSFRLNRKVVQLAVGMFKNNRWIWVAVLATLSFGTLSKIVLRHVSGSAQLGGYSVAWQVVPLGYILISQVSRIGAPRMAKMVASGVKEVDRMQFMVRYIGLTTLAGALVGIPAIIFPSLILRLFDPEYASVATTLQILGAYVILIGVGEVAAQYLIFVRRERAYSLVVMSSGALALGLYLVCIPLWWAKGAALAVLISHGIAIAAYLVMTFRHIHFVRKSEADLLVQAPQSEI